MSPQCRERVSQPPLLVDHHIALTALREGGMQTSTTLMHQYHPKFNGRLIQGIWCEAHEFMGQPLPFYK